MSYDSAIETLKHIRKVQANLGRMARLLIERGEVHDDSKLGPEEKPLFDKMTPLLSGVTYGSDEYRAMLAELRPALDHHNAVNSHHPEHYKLWKCSLCNGVFQEFEATVCDGAENAPRFCPKCAGGHAIYEAQLDPHISVDGFDLLDLVEMLCDWKAATERHNDGDIMRSIDINQKRFSMSPQLVSILRNTVVRMGWSKQNTPGQGPAAKGDSNG